MSVNPGVFGANPSFGYNPYGVNAGPALSGSGFNGAALSGYGAAPASGLGYYGGYQAAAAPSYGLGSYGVNPVGYQTAGVAAGYGYAPAVAAQGPFQLDEQTVAEIESRLAYLVRRRQPVLRRQIIKVPGPGGRVQQVVRRLPTPQPDLIERVYVVKPQRDVVNLLIERPGTPAPQVQERRVVGRPHRPVIHQQVVRVAPRTQVNQAAPLANYGYVSQPAVVNYAGYQPAAPAYVAQPQYSVSYSNSYDNLGGYGGYDAGYGYAAAQPAYGYAAAQPAYGYAAQPAYGYAAQPSVVAGYAAQPAYSYAAQPSYGYAAQPAYGGYGVQPSGASAVYGYGAQPAYGYGAPAYSGANFGRF